MKKVFYLLLVFSLSIGFASCSSGSSGSDEEDLIGYWKLTKADGDVHSDNSEVVRILNAEIQRLAKQDEGDIEFKEHGLYKHFDPTGRRWESAKYYVEKGSIFVGFYDKHDGWEFDSREYKLTGNTLVCYWDEIHDVPNIQNDVRVTFRVSYVRR